MPFRTPLLCLLLTSCLLTSVALGDEEKRFVALLEDGRVVEDNVLRNWYSGNAMPQLAGQSLIDGGNPMRWIIDRSLGPAEMPNAYIELLSGDRLPGHTDSYVAEGIEYQADQPEHFTLTPSFSYRKSSDSRYRTDLRVRRDFIRKIVWQQIPALVDRYVPSTVYLTNGREINFRAIRFSEGAIHLLSGRERMSFGFHEIAELHLPDESPWETQLRELAILFPGGKTDPADRMRLVQWETSEGLVATTSVQRIDADSRGDNNNSDRWIHGIQPAWALDPIWVECRSTWMRRSWPIDEIPLFRLPYQETREGAMFSRNGFPARVNRGVLAGTAKSGDHISGWNFGVMAPSRMSFELPPLAKGFRGSVGIDQAAKDRGCVRGKVFVSWESQPKFQSEPIIGSQKTVELGNINWNDVPTDGKLILEADMAEEGRPDDADPFDIRDMTNWIEPRLLLDREKLLAEIRERTPQAILAWKDWTVTSDPEKLQFQTSRRRVEYSYEAPSWRTTVAAKDQPLKLSTKRDIAPETRWLEIVTAKFDGNDQPVIDVTIDGILVLSKGLQNVNIHDYVNTPSPLLVDLLPFAGHEVTIEISQSAGSADIPVDWRGIHFLAQPSFLRPILDRPTEVEVDALATLNGDPGDVKWRNDLRLVSRPAIEVADGEDWIQIASFDPPLEIRERPMPGQFRQIRFNFSKRGEGHVLIRFLHNNDAESPAIYSVGTNKAPKGIFELDPKKVQEEWHEVTPDLFSSLGEVEITGIAIQSVGEGSSVWDHFLALASTHPYQFNCLTAIPPYHNNWDDWQKRSEDLLQRLPQAIVQVQLSPELKRPAVMVNQGEGIFAMLGDDNWKAGSTVELTRLDGQSFTAKRLGIDAESRLGFIQIENIQQDGKWAQYNLSGAERFDPRFAFMLLQPNAAGDGLDWDVSQPMTYTSTTEILTNPETFDCEVGAIAIDLNHQVAGFVIGKAPNRQPVLTIAHPLPKNWEKLKRGEN
ncbi:hypothetical protein [Bremerella cremea]|uniref:hypothetical protein n=1 Tax=Bremerella cremea TaxID=1031537 RepID=UPI0031EA86CC